MLKHGYKIAGIDGSQDMIDMAITYHPELDKHLSLEELPHCLTFENSSFDGIYSIAVLMHFELPDIKLIIQKVADILKHKGRFLFSVPLNRNNLDNSGYDKEGRLFTILSENNGLNSVMLCGLGIF